MMLHCGCMYVKRAVERHSRESGEEALEEMSAYKWEYISFKLEWFKP